MTKQKQMTDKELDQVSGGPVYVKVGDMTGRRGWDVGPVGRIGIEPNPSPAPKFKYGRIEIAPLPSP